MSSRVVTTSSAPAVQVTGEPAVFPSPATEPTVAVKAPLDEPIIATTLLITAPFEAVKVMTSPA